MEGSVRRGGVVFVALGFIFIGLSVRLFAIQVADHEGYAAKRDAHRTGFIDVRPPAGTITDARGEALAVSVAVPSIFRIPPPPTPVVEGPPEPRRHFEWVIRRATDADVARIKGMPGYGVRTEYVRRYPQGTVAAHVLGLRNIDDVGIEGLERSLDRAIGTRPHRGQIEVDALRVKLSYPDPLPGGADVQLTIDLVLQRIVEEELDAAVAQYRPKWASVVVMDPHTGAVLALANRPTFDPNAPVTDPRSHQNLALSAPYEPGSTLKPFIVAGALEEKLIGPRTMIDCEMGLWRHGARVLHDHHPYGSLTVADVVVKSSNIGAAKIGALTLGKLRLRKWASAFGFGRRTGVEMPLEDPGRLVALSRWSEFTNTSVPMGHEISCTVLQLTAAMSAIANGGKLMRPYVVARVGGAEAGRPPGVEILSKKTCEQMREMLAEVVKSGTGQKASIPGVQVAGKTGTTQKVDPATRQYTHERHIASFAGFAPAEDARLCLAVVIDEPQGAYYGGAVAAPVVANIIRRSLPHLK